MIYVLDVKAIANIAMRKFLIQLVQCCSPVYALSADILTNQSQLFHADVQWTPSPLVSSVLSLSQKTINEHKDVKLCTFVLSIDNKHDELSLFEVDLHADATLVTHLLGCHCRCG